MPHPKKIVHDSNKNICRMEEREDSVTRNTLVVLHWLVHTATSCGEGGKEKGGREEGKGEG